jgi:hypothetical protein
MGRWRPERRVDRLRAVAAVVLVVLLAPAVASGVESTVGGSTIDDDRIDPGVENVTFVTSQGNEFRDAGAAFVVIDTDTGERLRRYSEFYRYYDVDPLGNGRVLLVADTRGVDPAGGFFAVTMNWRTGEVVGRFPIPADTHDVDYVGEGEYAIADIKADRVSVYNRTREEIVWEFDFGRQYPNRSAGKAEGFTHLNDVDPINNGSAFLASPRNMDRVVLIDRSTKRVEWTLGSEDDYSIMNEQHNPTLLSRNPPTVLVADSENNRIVEYQKTGTGWEETWRYTTVAGWPRDADRLPNGNTLIVDTWAKQVIEVTPDKRVVARYEIAGQGTYDAERLPYGDEPTGPPMALLRERRPGLDSPPSGDGRALERSGSAAVLRGAIETVETSYYLAQWVLPSWLGKLEFAASVSAVVLALVWGASESYRAFRRRAGY